MTGNWYEKLALLEMKRGAARGGLTPGEVGMTFQIYRNLRWWFKFNFLLKVHPDNLNDMSDRVGHGERII